MHGYKALSLVLIDYLSSCKMRRSDDWGLRLVERTMNVWTNILKPLNAKTANENIYYGGNELKKMTTMLMSFILLALICMPAAMAASQAPITAEIQASVSFRDRPSTSSNVLRYLKAGDQVAVLGEVNAYWYQVQDVRGQIGYVSSSSKYIEITYNATIVSSVSFRKAASTDGARIRYLTKGESVLVIGQPNKYWFQVKDSNGVTGYVSSNAKYILTSAGVTIPSTGGQVGSTEPADSVNNNTSQTALIENIISIGMKYWGTPYEFGSDRNTTTTFDCSDFVRTAFREGASLTLPADSRQQGDFVKNKGSVTTDWHQLKRGDLMFFMDYNGSRASDYSTINKTTEIITHVGIYLGNGQVLHTYSTASGGVRTSDIANTAWDYRFLFGGSAL